MLTDGHYLQLAVPGVEPRIVTTRCHSLSLDRQGCRSGSHFHWSRCFPCGLCRHAHARCTAGGPGWRG